MLHRNKRRGNLIMTDTIKKVQDWAKERGIDKADPAKQLLKLTEEVGELAAAFIRGDDSNMQLEIGVVLVVLTIFCQQTKNSLESCFNGAYNKIKNRQGKNVNGVFVKSTDGLDWQR